MSPIIYIEETNSTNLYLKELLLDTDLEEGTIVATHHQTAGRGQRGNSWESEKGKNLTFSIVLYPDFISIQEQFILSQIISLAIKDTLNKFTTDISIKWPNDIYWREKKICGILIENSLFDSTIQNSIIGIGLNVNQEEFKSDAPNPISLKQITGEEQNLEEILSEIRDRILQYYKQIKENPSHSISEQYKKSLFRRDIFYLYHDGKKSFEAKISDILPSGHLILQTKSGEERTFAFKEVKYIL